MTSTAKLIRQSPEADATLAGDRAAIYHRQTRNAITLNPVGTILWQELAKRCSHKDLVKAIQDRWPQVDDAKAAADVANFLDQLRAQKLIIEE